MLTKILFTLVVIVSAASESFAHGTGFRTSELRAISLEFFYSTGEKMSYRDAKVFSPKDSKFAIQSGRTDEAGRFAFTPDSAGEWRVIVRDEEGHQCEAVINISEEWLTNRENKENDKVITAQSDSPEGIELIIRALLGVSLIFNLAAIIRIRRAAHAH
ncbi:MAG: hypothetical protein II917_05640 [Synergistaceae bacterium]|nr:hypothetical protein [Synergistaceae bacterium]